LLSSGARGGLTCQPEDTQTPVVILKERQRLTDLAASCGGRLWDPSLRSGWQSGLADLWGRADHV